VKQLALLHRRPQPKRWTNDALRGQQLSPLTVAHPVPHPVGDDQAAPDARCVGGHELPEGGHRPLIEGDGQDDDVGGSRRSVSQGTVASRSVNDDMAVPRSSPLT
jgi:hypothetical protein